MAAAVCGGLVLTGCQFATGGGTAICEDFTCGGSVQLEVAKAANGGLGGTVALDQAERQYGYPFPVFLRNHLVGDVTCFAMDGQLATAVFRVDPARSTIQFGAPAAAYSVSLYDGGPGRTYDMFLYQAVGGDLTTCAPPLGPFAMSPVREGEGFTVGEALLPGEH